LQSVHDNLEAFEVWNKIQFEKLAEKSNSQRSAFLNNHHAPPGKAPIKSHSFFFQFKKDKIACMDNLTQSVEAVQVQGLKELTAPGFASENFMATRLFITGGKGSEGRLVEACW